MDEIVTYWRMDWTEDHPVNDIKQYQKTNIKFLAFVEARGKENKTKSQKHDTKRINRELRVKRLREEWSKERAIECTN
jgi:hypothetical protein